MELWAKLRQVFRQGGRALGASARWPGTKDLFGGPACTAWALQAVLAGLGGGSENTAPVCFRLERSSHRQQDTSYWGSQQADWTPRTTPPDSAAQVTGTCSRPGCAHCRAGLRRNSPHLPLSEVRSKPKKPFSPALPVRQAGRQSKEHGGGGEGGCAFWEATHN